MLVTFISIVYNHEKYILQHLESIKYQINNFGLNNDIQLIISDDCSSDNTISLVNFWLSKNKQLFKYIDIVLDDVNRGVCSNFTKAMKMIKGDYVKFIAGDDVFSENNLFKFLSYLDEYDFIISLPYSFKNNKINNHDVDLKLSIYTGIVGNEKCMSEVIHKPGFFVNAPSTFFSKKILLNEDIIQFIMKFKMIEDYPLIIKASEVFPNSKIKFIPEIPILYRRTEQSISIIKKDDFYYDRIMIFNYLKDNEGNILKRLLIKNDIFSFKVNNGFLKRISKIKNYIYFLGRIINFKKINLITNKLNKEMQFQKNETYLLNIVSSSNKLLEEFKENK